MPVYLKFKHASDKRWSFMTPGGGSTYLKIHAARIADETKAQRIIDDNAADNPEFAWKIVRIVEPAGIPMRNMRDFDKL